MSRSTSFGVPTRSPRIASGPAAFTAIMDIPRGAMAAAAARVAAVVVAAVVAETTIPLLNHGNITRPGKWTLRGPIAGFGTIWQGGNPTNFYGADIWASIPAPRLKGLGGTHRFLPKSGAFLSWPRLYHFVQLLPRRQREPSAIRDGDFRRPLQSSGINGGDADPAQIIQDFLTNSQYGVGFPSGSIDATTLFSSGSGLDSSYQGYCRAAYLALSPALTNQETANSILARWLQ